MYFYQPRRAFPPPLRWLGSLKFAVATLPAVAAAMALGSVLESRMGAPVAWAWVYGRPWFALLLGLLAANIAAAAILRWPFRPRHYGFVVTHAGLILTLAGAAIGYRFGKEGAIRVREGETASAFANRDRDGVSILGTASGDLPVGYLPPPRTLARLDLASAPLRLRIGPPALPRPADVEVTGFWPAAEASEGFVEGDGPESPAVRVWFGSDVAGAGISAWLALKDPARRATDLMGLAEIRFREGNPSEISAEAKDPAPARREIRVADGIGKGIPLDGSGLTVRIEEYVPDAVVTDDRRLVNRSPLPNNPAIRFTLTGPDGERTLFAFEKYPDFPRMIEHHQGEPLPVDYVYDRTDGAMGTLRIGPAGRKRPSLDVLMLPGGTLGYVARSGDGRAERGTLRLGERRTLPWRMPGAGFRAEALVRRARAVREIVPVDGSRGGGRPAIRVRIRDGAGPGTEATLLREGDLSFAEDPQGGIEPTDVEVAGRQLRLLYGAAREPLGGACKVLGWRTPFWPGTMRNSAFETDLEVAAPGEAPLRWTLSMNHPLGHRGLKLSQSSYEPFPTEGDPVVTVIGVKSDPGLLLKYIGSGLIVVGIAMMFYLRGWLVRREAPSPREGPP